MDPFWLSQVVYKDQVHLQLVQCQGVLVIISFFHVRVRYIQSSEDRIDTPVGLLYGRLVQTNNVQTNDCKA
jgi:hypothetical protein